MNVKRILSVLMAVALLLCMFAGCGDDAKGTSSDSASVTSETESVVSSVSSDAGTTSSTTSRLTDAQIKMSGYLGGWSDSISTINSQSEGKFTFCIQTDTHYSDLSNTNVANNLTALANFVDFKFVANLGDLVRGYSVVDVDSPENMRDCMDELVKRYTKDAVCPVMLTVGNHDTNIMWCQKWADHTAQITPEEQYTRIFEPLKAYNGDAMVTDDDGSYYYMDFPEDKVRVVMLNSANGTYDGTKYSATFAISDKQVEWFKTEALNTDYSVLVMTHVPLVSSFPDTNGVPNGDKILAAVNDFVNFGGDFIAYLYGHVHAQNYLVDDDGRLHISFKNGGGYAEAVMIDLQNKTIETIGLGVSDRSFRYDLG